jgi:hypothetical protein
MQQKQQDGYFLKDGSFVKSSDLRKAGRDTQLDAMRTWFFENFEVPAEHTPYEGGYVYIWGGPYYAAEELEAEFEGLVSDDVIKELEDDLRDISWEWAPVGGGETELDDSFFGVSSDALTVFRSGIMDILSVLAEPMEAPSRSITNRLLYANVVTALESFLSDFFRSQIRKDPALFRRFVETTDAFKQWKISLSETYKMVGAMERIAESHLSSLVWHRLKTVGRLYQNVLNVSFPNDLSRLSDVIELRHELVHRNGKKADGSAHNITEARIREAIDLSEEFVHQIETRWMTISQAAKTNGSDVQEK